VLYPSVAVNSFGKGVVAFSVVGLNFFPSAGYAPIDVNGTGAIRIWRVVSKLYAERPCE
jgi:hypothetical protein